MLWWSGTAVGDAGAECADAIAAHGGHRLHGDDLGPRTFSAVSTSAAAPTRHTQHKRRGLWGKGYFPFELGRNRLPWAHKEFLLALIDGKSQP